MNDLLSQLPEYDPHPDLWARIEADLVSDEQLTRLTGDLPEYEPADGIWSAIDERLTQPIAPSTPSVDQPTPVRPLWDQPKSRQLWTGVAAAAVLILIGTWLMIRPEASENVRMEYAVEQAITLPDVDQSGNSSASDERAEAFIARQCAEQQLACQRPEVHELRNQLTSLSAEQNRIEQERLTFGDDPTLVRAQVKIENQRAEVTKELITLLRS